MMSTVAVYFRKSLQTAEGSLVRAYLGIPCKSDPDYELKRTAVASIHG